MNAPLTLCLIVLLACELRAGEVKGPAPSSGPTLRQAFTRSYAALPAQWRSAVASFLKSPNHDAAALERAFGQPPSLTPTQAQSALEEFLAATEKDQTPAAREQTATALGLLMGPLQNAFPGPESQESLRQAYEASKQPLGALTGLRIEEKIKRETASWRKPLSTDEFFGGEPSGSGASEKIIMPLTKPGRSRESSAETGSPIHVPAPRSPEGSSGGPAAKLVHLDRRTEPRDAMVGRLLDALKTYEPEIKAGRFEEIFIFTPDFALGDPQTNLPEDKRIPQWKRLSEPLIASLQAKYGKEKGAALWARLSELNRAMDDHDAVYKYGETAAAKSLTWMKENAGKLDSRATVIIDHDNPDTLLSALALSNPEAALRHEALVTEIARMWDHNMTESDLKAIFGEGEGKSPQWRAQVAGTIAMVRNYDKKVPFAEVLEALPEILDDVAAGRTERHRAEWGEPLAGLKEQYERPEKFVEALTPNVFVVRSKEDANPMDVAAFVLYNSRSPYAAGLKILIHYWPNKPGLTFNPVGANTARFPGINLKPLAQRLGEKEARLREQRGLPAPQGNWGGKTDVMGSVMESKSVFTLRELTLEIQSFLDEPGSKP